MYNVFPPAQAVTGLHENQEEADTLCSEEDKIRNVLYESSEKVGAAGYTHTYQDEEYPRENGFRPIALLLILRRPLFCGTSFFLGINRWKVSFDLRYRDVNVYHTLSKYELHGANVIKVWSEISLKVYGP